AGEEVERAPRPVTVMRFDTSATDDPLVYRIEVDCSSGTYVRSLAADLGAALGGGAHLRNLRRTAIGSFTVDEATPLDDVTDADGLSALTAMRDYPAKVGDGAELVAASHGRTLSTTPEGVWCLVDGGELVAVYEGSSAAVVVRPAN